MYIEPIGDSIWLAEGGIVSFYGFPYPTRSVAVRLPSGKLWIWSPLALTPELLAWAGKIGPVSHLVSPNKLHHLYLQDWKAAFPDAVLWGLPSLIEKRKDLSFSEPLGDDPPAEWEGVFDQAWFRGSKFMDEMVFYHKPSATAILADLSENFSEEFLRDHWSWWQRPLARLWGITEGNGCAPFEWRLSFTDRKLALAALHKMLGWPSERVVMAHGVWQQKNGRTYLQHAFRWLEK